MMKFKKILMIWKIAWQNPLKVNIGFHSLVYLQEKCRCLCTKTHGRQEKMFTAAHSVSPTLETVQCPPAKGCGQTVEESHNGILHSRENE